MRVPRLSPRAYERVTLVAVVLLALIIVSGGAVRLTGSGLGCPDWPNCEPGRLAPRSASDLHPMVEFVNRTVTGLVSVGVIVAVLGSLVRSPRRLDLVVLSCGLVAGVVVQIVLGALVVEKLLSPPWVMAHFLVSAVLLANALLLHRRAQAPRGPAAPLVAPPVVWMGRLLVLAAAAVIVTGTVVTGAGPHSGDVPGVKVSATRLDFPITDVARVHGTTVMAFLALVVATFVLVGLTGAPRAVQRRLGLLLMVVVAQAAVGYLQYFNGIPALLVGLHIAGATSVWAATVWFALGLHTRGGEPSTPTPAAPRELAGVSVGLR